MEGTTGISRRSFVSAMCALGAAAAIGESGVRPNVAVAAETEFSEPAVGNPVEASVDVKTGDVTVNEDVIIRYSTCLGCYSTCGNRVKMPRSADHIYSVGGNPYHPGCAYPYLPFEAPLEDAYRSMSFADGYGNLLRGTVCGRGNGTLDGYTQPDRITMPLKRAGKRGEGKWKPISWEQLITEVTEGGKLFEEIGEDTEIAGFKALHDTETPMNPDQPGLGPISNQIVALGGRGDGRGGMHGRFLKAYGTVNQYGHGST